MNSEIPQPTGTKLRGLLREARPAPPPVLPRFRESVWRRIERAGPHQEAVASPAWLDRLVERLFHPRFALAGVTVLLLMSTLAGVVRGTESARQAAQARYLAAVAPNPVR